MVDNGHTVYVKIDGAVETAAPYVGLAKHKTRELAAKHPNQYQTEWGYLDTDIKYCASVTPHHWSVTIYVEPKCTPAPGGVYSEVLPFKNQEGTWIYKQENADQWVVSYKKNIDGTDYYDVNGKRTVTKTGLVDFRSRKKPLPHNASVLGSGFTGVETQLRDFVISELVFLDKFKASKYTGKMRKVVQVLLGLGYKTLVDTDIASGAPDNPTFLFNYTFNETHGIYVSGNGDWWVIRIDSDGIWRRKAVWCKTRSGKDVRIFKYYEVLSDEDGNPLPEEEQWTKIGSVAAIYSNYGASHTSCGWAFSPDGRNIQNVVFDTQSVGANDYVRGHRVKITISESENVPTGAIYSIVESNFVWSRGFATGNNGHFHVPDEKLRACTTFDYNKRTTVLPTDNPNGPLFVFYADDGTEVVVRSGYEVSQDKSPSNTVNTLVPITYFSFSGNVPNTATGMFAFGTSTNPISVTAMFESKTYTPDTSIWSNLMSCSVYPVPKMTDADGGTSDVYYKTAGNIGEYGSLIFWGIMASGTRYENGLTPPDDTNYCFTATPFTDKSALMEAVFSVVHILKVTTTTTARYTDTECGLVVPYGDRQCAILTSQITNSAHTITENYTSEAGNDMSDWRGIAAGFWATDKACVNQFGSTTALSPPGDVSAWHYGRYDFGTFAWGWGLSPAKFYSCQIDTQQLHPVSQAELGRWTGVIATRSGTNAFVYNESNIPQSTATEPTRQQFSRGGAITTPMPAPPAQRVINTPQIQYQYAVVLGAGGQVIQMPDASASAWASAAVQYWDFSRFLICYASFDAFYPNQRYMYSRFPQNPATVTYAGVPEFTAATTFGFAGYEGLTDGN